MALIFCDGFDHYVLADVLKKWTSIVARADPYATGTGLYPANARPPGGQGLLLMGDNNDRYLAKTLQGNYGTLIFGANIKMFESRAFNADIMGFTETGTKQIEVGTDSSGRIVLKRNGTVLATSTNSLQVDVWYHLEVKVAFHASAGTYEVRIDGTSTGWIGAATSQDTTNTANNYANQVRLNWNQYGVYWDDVFVLDTTGSVANDFIGPQKIITVYPTGAGNSTQFTGNYAANFANVNESTGDGDWTANQSSTAGHIDLFDFDNVPTGTINGIQHVLQARQDAGAARTIRAKTRISSTNYNGSSVALTGSYRYITDPVTLNPADSAAWEATDINGAEFGYELVS